MTLNDILPRLEGVTGSGGQYSARCPAHDDKRASLRISEEKGKILLFCHAGCAFEDITAALDLKPSDLFAESRTSRTIMPQSRPEYGVPVQYIYTDINGNNILRKTRTPDKRFFWEYFDGYGWQKGRNKIEPPLFNQHMAKDSKCVYVVEGEKDVLTLAAFGRAAVSLADGAKSKWRGEYAEFFAGKRIAIIQDNDEPGKEYAQMIADKLIGVAESVTVLDLSMIWHDMPAHADVTDFVECHGGDITAVSELAQNTPAYIPPKPEPLVKSLASIETTETTWLWKPYIPRGKITLLTADPGTGKTFFCLYLAAALSNGAPFWGQGCIECEPDAVVYQTAEDGLSDTIKPRLETMNPDFERIFFIDETDKGLNLSDDRIEKVMKEYRPALIIFDPLQAYLGAAVDMHRANEVRPILARIGHLAEKYNCAVLFVMHHSKETKSQALYRALGSIDIPAIARSMLIMANNPDEPNQKLIFHEKSSLAKHGQTISFHIDFENGGVVFDGFSDKKADEVIRAVLKIRKSEKRENVKDTLLVLFGGRDAVKLEEIETLQAMNGWGQAILYRARKELEIKTVSLGFAKNKVTWWLLPEVDENEFRERMNREEAERQAAAQKQLDLNDMATIDNNGIA